MKRLYRRVMCALGHCGRCRLHETADGIGGQCTNCGKIHGWMSRDELRRIR